MVLYNGSLPDARGYRLMLNSIKNELHLRLDELFAEAAIDELSGDMTGYQHKLSKIIQVADVLEVETEISIITVSLKDMTNN